MSLKLRYKLCFLMLALSAIAARGQITNLLTYTFDDGQVPFNTALTPSGTAGINPGLGVTNGGGLNNSGLLKLTIPASGQTFGHWTIPDLANGQPVTNLSVSFLLYVGQGSGGNSGVPGAGGNGMVFHWGAALPEQYTGSASTWGNGLDVNFRTFNSAPNSPGINIAWGWNGLTPGAANLIATNSYLGYFQGQSNDFSAASYVSLSLTNSGTNGYLTLVVTNRWAGLTNVYSNLLVPGFTNLAGYGFAFTASDGSGAHENCWLDNVDFTLNGTHVSNNILTGPVVITSQPASQTVPENVYARFTVGVGGTSPFTYQWMSNGLAIAGATAPSYTTPTTSLAMNGTVYAIAVTNALGGALSSNATLTVVHETTPASLAIYTDHLVNGFQDWSWGTRNLYTTSPVHSGTDSITASASYSDGLSFYHSDFNTSPYASLSLWLNGGSLGGQIVRVQVLLGGVGQTQYPLPALAANTWQQFIIPLSSLNAANKTNFDRLTFQLGSSGAAAAYYVDDIQLTGQPAPALVHLNVNAAQAVRRVDARMFGVNTATWDGSLDTPQTVSLLNEMGCLAMRFPGGSTADTYHWTPSTVVHFAHAATNIGAVAINTVNYGSGSATEAAGWASFCNVTNRYAFKYWEIGNENYGTWETDYNTNSPYQTNDGWTYAQRAVDYFQQMKAADPAIKVGVVVVPGETSFSNGYTNHPAYNPRTSKTNYGWTPVLLTTLKSLGLTPDFAIDHRYPEYTPSGNLSSADSDPLLLQSSSWRGDAADLRQQISDYFGPGGSNIELIVTENNSDAGHQGKQSVSLVNALYYADSLAQLMQTEFNGFAWWDLRNGTDTQGSLDPTLYGWRLYGDLGMINGLTNRYPDFYAAKLMQYFARSGDTVLNASSDYILLSAYAARRASGAVTLLVINKDVAATFDAKIALNGLAPFPAATLRSYGIPQDAAAQSGVGTSDIATSIFFAAGTNFNYSFPPLSLTLFTFAPAAPRLAVLPPSAQPGDQIVLQLQGQPGVYIIQTSTNLSAWAAVSTNTLTASTLNLTNAVAPGPSQRFWRSLWQP